MSATLAIAMLLVGFFVICSVLAGVALMAATFERGTVRPQPIRTQRMHRHR